MVSSLRKHLDDVTTPIINQGIATFFWKGRTPPLLIGDFNGWDPQKPAVMTKIEPNIWTYQLTLPQDAYIEYGFLKGSGRLNDPLNPRLTSNGEGGYNNYFYMPANKSTELAKKNSLISHGVVNYYRLSTESLLSGRFRSIHLYQPPVMEPVPLLVVWDGQDYLRRVRLTNIIDNLIDFKRISPIAIAFVNNGGQKSRSIEYACNEATLAFLMTAVIPLAVRELNLLDIHANPGAYGVLGASMGGLMALYTGLRFPDVFGKVLCQSGAFSMAGIDTVVFNLLEHCELYAPEVWMDVGIYDIPELLESRRMQKILIQKGCSLDYHEYHAGHNYPSWRDDIWRGLEVLFPA